MFSRGSSFFLWQILLFSVVLWMGEIDETYTEDIVPVLTDGQEWYWSDKGGERPVQNGECPALDQSVQSSAGYATVTPFQQRYKKCYKTKKEHSMCFVRGGDATNEDCFERLFSNLRDPRRHEIVCCPGACGWIYEHAWVSGQALYPARRRNFEAVYAHGILAETVAAAPPPASPTIKLEQSAQQLYPVLRAGCIVSPPQIRTAASNTPEQTPALLRSCPAFAYSGPSQSPNCVQRLYSTGAALASATGALQSVVEPQTSCTIHCCENDLCNGVNLEASRSASAVHIGGIMITDNGVQTSNFAGIIVACVFGSLLVVFLWLLPF